MTPKKWEPTVRKRGDSWVVDCGHVFGQRIRKQFATVEDRDEFIAAKIHDFNERRKQQQVDAKNKSVLRLGSLPDGDRRNIMAAVLAIEKAGGNSSHLLEAANYYVDHLLSVKLNRTVAEVVADYQDAKTKAERSPRTIRSSRLRLASFVEQYGNRLIHSVATTDCEQWLDAGGWRKTTRNDQRRALFGLFKYAMGRGFCKVNPVEPIEKVTTRKGKPAVFTVEQARTLLNAAANFIPTYYAIECKNPLRGSVKPVTDSETIAEARAQLVPYIAIGLFCGLRPENELRNLDWSNVMFDADKPFIRVDAETSKVHAARDVMMPPNLIQWLAPYRKASGKIGYSKKRLAAVIKQAELTWSPDIMRHSFGSYHLAHGRNVTETAHQMGSSPRMIRQHYENLRTAKEGAEYFATEPEKPAIPIPAFARAG